jgi:hypothetical protein
LHLDLLLSLLRLSVLVRTETRKRARKHGGRCERARVW